MRGRRRRRRPRTVPALNKTCLLVSRDGSPIPVITTCPTESEHTAADFVGRMGSRVFWRASRRNLRREEKGVLGQFVRRETYGRAGLSGGESRRGGVISTLNGPVSAGERRLTWHQCRRDAGTRPATSRRQAQSTRRTLKRTRAVQIKAHLALDVLPPHGRRATASHHLANYTIFFY